MMSTSAYDEVADFIAKMNPSNVIKFNPSAKNQKTYRFFIGKT